MRKLFFLLCLLPFFFHPLYAKKWRINNNTSIAADFTSIIEAHNGASAGDTLYIEGSINQYDGTTQITITKPLVLIGPGYLLTANDSTQANKQDVKIYNLVFEAGSAGSQVMGMVLSYVDVKVNDVVVQRNYIGNLILRAQNSFVLQNYITGYIQDNGGSGIISHNIVNYMTASENASYQVFNNVVYYPSGNVLNIYNSEIRNNIILGPMVVDAARKGAITHNLFAQEGQNSNNNQFKVDMATVFVNEGSEDGKYLLKAGSPAKGAGLEGVDCGVFGGSSHYVLSGIPPGPSIYEASAPASAPKGAGMLVRLKIKSHN